jgi:hypothetical protein
VKWISQKWPLMNHYKVNTDDHPHFPAIKKSAHGPNSVSYFFNVYKTFSLNKMINKRYYTVGTVIKSNR